MSHVYDDDDNTTWWNLSVFRHSRHKKRPSQRLTLTWQYW